MTALCTAIAAASLLVAIFTAGVVDIAFRLEFVARRRWTNASVPAGAIALPAIAGTLFAIALSVPNPFGTCHCAAHGLHHPHLCVFTLRSQSRSCPFLRRL